MSYINNWNDILIRKAEYKVGLVYKGRLKIKIELLTNKYKQNTSHQVGRDTKWDFPTLSNDKFK